MTNRTFTIIKPNAVGQRHTGEILEIIEKAGFRILALKMVCLSRSDVEKFYHVHKERPFFRTLNNQTENPLPSYCKYFQQFSATISAISLMGISVDFLENVFLQSGQAVTI